MCLEYNKFIYPRCSRVEVAPRLTGWQALPITSSGRLETQAEVILHAPRLEAFHIYIYVYIQMCL